MAGTSGNHRGRRSLDRGRGTAAAEELHPDAVLVDLDLGGESGFELTEQLQHAGVDLSRVILISGCAEEDYAELIAASPAVGFLSKTGLSSQKIRDLVEIGRARV